MTTKEIVISVLGIGAFFGGLYLMFGELNVTNVKLKDGVIHFRVFGGNHTHPLGPTPTEVFNFNGRDKVVVIATGKPYSVPSFEFYRDLQLIKTVQPLL